MKKFNLLIVMALFALTVNAQEVKFPGLDTSPADIAYFPLNTTKAKKGVDSAALIKVILLKTFSKRTGDLWETGSLWTSMESWCK
ncbi:hypothetical protein [Pedobacter sp. NJ-S-72]